MTQADPSADSRKESRDSLFMMAALRWAGDAGTCRVRLRNLSPSGFMAETPIPLPPGTQLEVEIRGIGWVGGTVAWQLDRRIGVAFHEAVDPLAARSNMVTGSGNEDVMARPSIAAPPRHTPRPPTGPRRTV